MLHRKWQLAMLFFSVVGFPLLMWALVLLGGDNRPLGLFIAVIAAAIINTSTSVLFIPLWITVFVGQEFSSNHVNKAVFLTSRKEYFTSKIIYCCIVSLLFTVVESISIAISLNNDLFQSTITKFSFISWFMPHVFIINILYSLVFLCLTFAFRSPKASLLTAYFLPQLDGILFNIFDMAFNIKLNWFPFKLLYSMYIRNGYNPGKSKQYFNPIYEGDFLIFIAPAAFVAGLCFLSYRWFLVRDLKTMSD